MPAKHVRPYYTPTCTKPPGSPNISPNARLVFRANNQVAQAIAARSGAGVAILPHYVGRTEAELRLFQLGPTPPARDVWILTRRAGWNDAPIRTVANHIACIFAQEQALFECAIEPMARSLSAGVRSIGIRERPTSSRSPWQNAYAERQIGSIRRENTDHIVTFGERHLRHVLLSYMGPLQRHAHSSVVEQGRADIAPASRHPFELRN